MYENYLNIFAKNKKELKALMLKVRIFCKGIETKEYAMLRMHNGKRETRKWFELFS